MRTRTLTAELTTYRPTATRWPVGLRITRGAITGGISLGPVQRAWLLTWRAERS